MEIGLRFHHFLFNGQEDKVQRKTMEVLDSDRIEDILPKLYGKSVAIWMGSNKYEEGLVSRYMDFGELQEGLTYNILSDKIFETMRVMDRLENSLN